MSRRQHRATGPVVGLAVLAASASLYVVTHGSSRSLPLGPTELVVAPVAAPRAVVGHAGPTTRGTRSAVSTVSAAWVATYAGRTGIPARALTAYADAALRAPCPVGWTTLAGIGWVESAHGTTDGRPIGSDGRPARPILGPVLDGHGSVAAVRGSKRGWARALGPMQFLPSTWRRWRSDGDGDGVADPQDLDDAAYTAARYLCASGQDPTSGPGWAAMVRSYNHDDAYVRAVYEAASAYAARSSG